MTKIVHHDRLKPVRYGVADDSPTMASAGESDSTGSDSSSEHSDYSPSEDDSSDSDDGEEVGNRYPVRDRRPRAIPGAFPWSAVPRV